MKRIMENKLRYSFILILTIILGANQLNAQVTIGSGNASLKGTLLQLKENDKEGVNSNRGLGLPRVRLVTANKILETVPAGEELEHVGLLVYHVGHDDICDKDFLEKGIYIWNGKEWDGLGNINNIALGDGVRIFTDKRDGNNYLIRDFENVGTWMVQNLRARTYTSGRDNAASESTVSTITGPSLSPTNNKSQVWVYPLENGETNANSTTVFDEDNSYGFLYTKAAATKAKPAGVSRYVQGVCPQGWHLPSKQEWDELIQEVVANPTLYTSETALSNAQGAKGLKDICQGGVSKTKEKGGFAAMLAGIPTTAGAEFNTKGAYWTADDIDANNGYALSLLFDTDKEGWDKYEHKRLLSVRCKENCPEIKATIDVFPTGILTPHSKVTLTAKSVGSNLRYQWYKKTGDVEIIIAGATEATYTILDLDQNTLGSYFCRIADNCSTEDTETKSIFPQDPTSKGGSGILGLDCLHINGVNAIPANGEVTYRFMYISQYPGGRNLRAKVVTPASELGENFEEVVDQIIVDAPGSLETGTFYNITLKFNMDKLKDYINTQRKTVKINLEAKCDQDGGVGEVLRVQPLTIQSNDCCGAALRAGNACFEYEPSTTGGTGGDHIYGMLHEDLASRQYSNIYAESALSCRPPFEMASKKNYQELGDLNSISGAIFMTYYLPGYYLDGNPGTWKETNEKGYFWYVKSDLDYTSVAISKIEKSGTNWRLVLDQVPSSNRAYAVRCVKVMR